jgi:glyoxylase-like metal-dependent hydrolase (beta-lactamase superfamily II)
MVHILDLHFLNLDHAIASFLIETTQGPVIVETGPYSTFPSMKKRLAEHGYQVSDVKNVFLTHIHFDHAGAAWAFAKEGAKIYVHPFGAPHMEDPSKLYNSAKQIYLDQMERLWGAMEKIPADQLIPVDDAAKIVVGETEIIGWHTPGHARHHITWQLADMLFTGDVAGVKIENGPVVAPCPPPDINQEEWNQSIDSLLEKNAKKLFLTHYGEVTEISDHFHALRKILNDWAYWMKEKWEQGMSADEITPLFTKYTADQLRSKGVSDHGLERYEAANPSWMSVAGLIRYWKKKSDSSNETSKA